MENELDAPRYTFREIYDLTGIEMQTFYTYLRSFSQIFDYANHQKRKPIILSIRQVDLLEYVHYCIKTRNFSFERTRFLLDRYIKHQNNIDYEAIELALKLREIVSAQRFNKTLINALDDWLQKERAKNFPTLY